MTRYALTAAGVLLAAGLAPAQYPTYPGPTPYAWQAPYYQTPTVMPNIYNPANQPLSPYLNLLRGGNPAVNYFYGTRPGTVGGTGLGIGAPFTSPGASRQPFFPQLANQQPEPPLPGEEPLPGYSLPPAGHPVYFNNTMGYFPSPFGARGGAQSRSGLAGVGATSRPARPAG